VSRDDLVDGIKYASLPPPSPCFGLLRAWTAHRTPTYHIALLAPTSSIPRPTVPTASSHSRSVQLPPRWTTRGTLARSAADVLDAHHGLGSVAGDESIGTSEPSLSPLRFGPTCWSRSWGLSCHIRLHLRCLYSNVHLPIVRWVPFVVFRFKVWYHHSRIQTQVVVRLPPAGLGACIVLRVHGAVQVASPFSISRALGELRRAFSAYP
jgi:hypothetical protein